MNQHLRVAFFCIFLLHFSSFSFQNKAKKYISTSDCTLKLPVKIYNTNPIYKLVMIEGPEEIFLSLFQVLLNVLVKVILLDIIETLSFSLDVGHIIGIIQSEIQYRFSQIFPKKNVC